MRYTLHFTHKLTRELYLLTVLFGCEFGLDKRMTKAFVFKILP